MRRVVSHVDEKLFERIVSEAKVRGTTVSRLIADTLLTYFPHPKPRRRKPVPKLGGLPDKAPRGVNKPA